MGRAKVTHGNGDHGIGVFGRPGRGPLPLLPYVPRRWVYVTSNPVGYLLRLPTSRSGLPTGPLGGTGTGRDPLWSSVVTRRGGQWSLNGIRIGGRDRCGSQPLTQTSRMPEAKGNQLSADTPTIHGVGRSDSLSDSSKSLRNSVFRLSFPRQPYPGQ